MADKNKYPDDIRESLDRTLKAFGEGNEKRVNDTYATFRAEQEAREALDMVIRDHAIREAHVKAGRPSNFDDLRDAFISQVLKAVGGDLANRIGLRASYSQTSVQPVFLGVFSVGGHNYYIVHQAGAWQMTSDKEDFAPTSLMSVAQLRSTIDDILEGDKPDRAIGFKP